MKKAAKGFTLIELMIVVAIIGILAAIAIPNFLRFQLRARFGELKENVGSVFKSEEALRQSERSLGGTTGQYVALGMVPAVCDLTVPVGTTKHDWVNTDFQIARAIDWAVEGKTYGCYHVGTTSYAAYVPATPGTATMGIHLTVYAESDIDGDGVRSCVYLYKATLGSDGNPSATGTRVDATCTNAPVFPATSAAASWGIPMVADDNVF